MSSRTRAYLLLLIATIIWGVAGPVIKFTLDYLPPSIFLTYRFAIQAGIGLVWLRFIKHPGWPKDSGLWLNIILYSILTIPVGLGLLFLGYNQTSALAVSIIDAIYPTMVAVVGVGWLHEHVTRRERWGMGMATLGTTLVIIEPLLTGNSHSSSSLAGNLLVIASLVVGVVSVVMAKVIMRHKINALAMTHLTFILGFVSLAPIAIWQYGLGQTISSLVQAPTSAHIGVWYMALLSGTLAYWLWLMAQRSIEIGETAVFTYLYPVITLPLSVFWLHENVTPVLILGSVIIATGVILAETKRNKKMHAGKR